MPRKPGEDPKPKVKYDETTRTSAWCEFRSLNLKEQVDAAQGYVAMLKSLKRHAEFADWCEENEKPAA